MAADSTIYQSLPSYDAPPIRDLGSITSTPDFSRPDSTVVLDYSIPKTPDFKGGLNDKVTKQLDSLQNRMKGSIASLKDGAKKDAARLDAYTKSNSKTYQELYKKTSWRNHAFGSGNEFRNKRHGEFLEHNPFAVRLQSMASNNVVALRVSPNITESGTVEYKAIAPLHMPGAIQIYQNSSPRTWSVSSIKLVSRNAVEAEENLAIVNQFRAWRLPFFGSSTTSGRDGFQYELYGAPPEVLWFSAYSNANDASGVTNLRKVPVVITSLTIPWDPDVDYIETVTSKQPFPVIMSIDLTLLEQHSPRDFERFDLIAYKNGNLRGF